MDNTEIINKVIIKPFEFVDKVPLGEYRKNIIRSLGKAPYITINNIDKSLIEIRGEKEFLYIKEGSGYILDSIACSKNTTPFIDDINIFEVGLDKLKEIDNDFDDDGAWATFRKLGIAVGGLGKKKIPEKRTVIAYRRDSLYIID
jgi:hypothetical protein